MSWSHTVTAWRVDIRSEWTGVIERGRAVIDRFPRASLWIFFTVMSAARFPATFRNPQFYAEEGNVYFGYAANHGLIDSLFERHVGYFSLVANVGGILSSLAPLEQAVTVTRIVGFIGPVACAWVIISAQARMTLRAVALGVVVFTFTMTTEWATTIHAQFWLAVAVIVMIAVDPSERGGVGQYVLALVAGLTGVLACVAAPAYFLQWFHRRKRRDAIIGAILGVALVVQFVVATSRDPSWNAGEFVVVAFLKLAFYPFTGLRGQETGVGWYESWSSIPVAVVFTVLLGVWITWVVVTSRDRWRLVTVTSVAAGLVGLYFAIPPYPGLALAYIGTRYSVAGVVPVLIALVMSWNRNPVPTRLMVAVLVALAVIRGADAGVDLSRAELDRAPVWGPSVAAFRDDPGVTPAANPWCRISVNADAQRNGFDVERAVLDDGGLRFAVTPGRYDTEVAIRAYVISVETLEVLTPDGWQPLGGYLYGDATRRCHQPSGPVPALADARGPFEVEVSADALESVAQRSSSILVGYGRSFPDALAKDTLVDIGICRLRGDLCAR